MDDSSSDGGMLGLILVAVAVLGLGVVGAMYLLRAAPVPVRSSASVTVKSTAAPVPVAAVPQRLPDPLRLPTEEEWITSLSAGLTLSMGERGGSPSENGWYEIDHIVLWNYGDKVVDVETPDGGNTCVEVDDREGPKEGIVWAIGASDPPKRAVIPPGESLETTLHFHFHSSAKPRAYHLVYHAWLGDGREVWCVGGWRWGTHVDGGSEFEGDPGDKTAAEVNTRGITFSVEKLHVLPQSDGRLWCSCVLVLKNEGKERAEAERFDSMNTEVEVSWGEGKQWGRDTELLQFLSTCGPALPVALAPGGDLRQAWGWTVGDADKFAQQAKRKLRFLHTEKRGGRPAWLVRSPWIDLP